MFERFNSILKPLDKFIIIAFFCSFVNSFAATAFCILLLIYIQYGVEGEVKILLWITFRGVLSSAVAAGIGSSIIKWGMLIGISLLIVITSNVDEIQSWKVAKVSKKAILFSVAVGICSAIVSSYPVTACFKLLSFLLPLLAIIKGISMTKSYCKWVDYLCAIMTLLMLISFCMIPFGRFRIVNNDLQGIFNHVNTLGVMCAIYIALLLRTNIFDNKRRYKISVIIGTLVLAYLSASRTGLLSCILILVLYYAIYNIKIALVLIPLLGIYFLGTISSPNINNDNFFTNSIHEFMWKNSTDSIFDSRMEIAEESMQHFEKHRLTGTGFMVPYIEQVKDYSLKYDLVVEPGSLIYMLLGDTGYIGSILFVLFIISVFKCGKMERLYMLLGALITNMGEMAFFSSNNYSILFYFLIAIYMFDESIN